jgi:calcium permeable stress-gated cation channel
LVFDIITSGLDAVMFLVVVKFIARFFTWGMMLAIPLIFIHLFAYGTRRDGELLQLIDMNHLPANSNLYWVHVAFSWITTAWFFYEMYVIWNTFIELRQEYLTSDEYINAPHNSTLLVTEIPKDKQDRTSIREYIAPVQPRNVLLGRNFGKLYEIFLEHEKVALKLEKVLAKYLKDPNHLPAKRPTHSEGGLFGICGTKVDSISFYGEQLDRLAVEIYKIRIQPNDSFEPNSSAFVLFKSAAEAQAAEKKLSTFVSRIESRLSGAPTINRCPDYDDLSIFT